MKNALLLLVSATALSLASCSQEKTTDTTTTTAPANGTTTTTTTVSDATYKSRGTRMADKFASDMKISDEATKEKLRTAYYNRSKRYDELVTKYKADTAGYAAARRDYNTATDSEFQTILLVPAQYSAYQSSRSNYDEASNLNTTDQTATAAPSNTTPSADSTTMSTTTTTSTTTSTSDNTMGSGAMVEKGKTKLSDGSKVKVKTDGTVKVKDADGNKAKM